jgi:hypothetical protein
MTFPVTVFEDRRIEPNAIVTHTHCECPLGKDDLHFDQPGTCMSKGIPDSLPSDPIRLIAYDRFQFDRSTLHQYAKIRPGTGVVDFLELVPQVRERLWQISAFGSSHPKLADGLPALIDRRQASVDCDIDVVCGLLRPVRQEPAYGLESEHHSLKAL